MILKTESRCTKKCDGRYHALKLTDIQSDKIFKKAFKRSKISNLTYLLVSIFRVRNSGCQHVHQLIIWFLFFYKWWRFGIKDRKFWAFLVQCQASDLGITWTSWNMAKAEALVSLYRLANTFCICNRKIFWRNRVHFNEMNLSMYTAVTETS